METDNRCPKCGSESLHRRAAASRIARMRKRLTRKRPHVCTNCGWHGWRLAGSGPPASHAFTIEPLPPDLAEIDAVLAETFPKQSIRV